MKIMEIYIVAFFIACTCALNPAEFQNCPPNQECSQLRGFFHFEWNTMETYQKYKFGGRSWVIRPKGGQSTTITMVFKEFKIQQSMYIAMDSGGQIEWKQIFPSFGKDFELLITDVKSVTIYVPMSERGRFHAFYYVGCSVLTKSSSEIRFPDIDQVVGLKSTCWVIKPMEVRDIGRIYLSLKDVYLMADASITIQELHSGSEIAEVKSTSPYDIFARDTNVFELILIDLKCNDILGTCDSFGNIFFLSYYAVDTSDVACIETQKHCALDPWYNPQSVCSRNCPTLENIIEEEFERDGPSFTQQAPILKSGVLAAAAKHTEEIEEHGNNSEDEEEEEEEVEERENVIDKRIKPKKKPASRPIRCQIRGKYCKCLRTRSDAKQYCFSKRKCNTFGTCAIACIWSRILICAKMTSAASIDLLSG